MFKYSITATIVAVVLTFIAIAIFKTLDAVVAIGASSITASMIVYWFARTEGRTATKKEKNKLVSTYGICMLFVYIVPVLFAASPTNSGVIMMIILSLSYPLFMLIFFTDKNMSRYIKNEPNE